MIHSPTPARPVLHLPQFEANRFNQFQTRHWQPGDQSRLSGSYPKLSFCLNKVGILRPNWLDGANYLGQQFVNGFHCNVWEKVDFIWYYEDVETKRPVQWIFYTGREAHVMTFEVGAVLEDEKWQAPVYCFNKEKSLSTEGSLREFRGCKGMAV
ncbi:hypothetical protein DY000_02060763, partial [Brassica cretica]